MSQSATPRQLWMAVLARATADELRRLLQDCPELPEATVLRGPEGGLVMLRGRAGGGGVKFNLGEATVIRCTVRDAGGRIGHAYRLGRDAEAATLSARLDAALQAPDLTERLQVGVIARLAADQQARASEAAGRAAATRVEFYTMATMRTDP